ncbi:MAG: type 1 glutamine amidotransferase [Pirellulaceae bacterium]|jgi:GMP synthase (glutamine-hydrolysing)|nr:type 1 glutamine amidotransferase [Pirellulaceae bacterium]
MTATCPPARLRFLLLQMRNAQDPIRHQEVACFVRALGCAPQQLAVFDLLAGAPTRADLQRVDMVLLGGSGDYSVVAGGDWLPAALAAMRELYDWSVPTFASCWGFQAMARALGGEVVTDLHRAELGTELLELTPEGRRDPVFGRLPPRFAAHMGHQDIVDRLPPQAVLLASSARVRHQAFCVPGKPIYCTQFHPELTRPTLLQRAQAYPEYVARIAGVPLDEFSARCTDAPESEVLLQRCVRHFFGP